MEKSAAKVLLIYDGECPVCRRYAQAVRVSQQFGGLETLSAREPDPRVGEIIAQGYDLDEGMVVQLEGVNYHGADALNVMAMISTQKGWFNRFNFFLFKSPKLAKLCYPMMRAGRNLLLRLLGVKKLADS
ncbi:MULTISPECIES: DCC1-like thiol-disulfide oxidoreductase family protein [Corallincola]|uniref:DUF393 domain-containing protein n=2 Tax=Corallincola TaxID=1775176 RepID=A0ABY1WUX1_9GAMM|nr:MULTISPECIES: DCC1-like thiol-disulfide oxidoreductase family protein [Corallincola]TAA48551.1 DUF393 domain-containing protein [Corallincola spongiicola]TCI05591.1 DUF393 domain-containing protein [Corallincola luteus]